MNTRFFDSRRPEGYSQRPGGPVDESSLSQDLPETSQTRTLSPLAALTPHRVINHSTPLPASRPPFPILWNNLWHQGKKLRNPRLRPTTKQQLAKGNSWVWQHGQELKTDDNDRVFICRICHLGQSWNSGVYIAESTGAIATHH